MKLEDGCVEQAARADTVLGDMGQSPPGAIPKSKESTLVELRFASLKFAPVEFASKLLRRPSKVFMLGTGLSQLPSHFAQFAFALLS